METGTITAGTGLSGGGSGVASRILRTNDCDDNGGGYGIVGSSTYASMYYGYRIVASKILVAGWVTATQSQLGYMLLASSPSSTDIPGLTLTSGSAIWQSLRSGSARYPYRVTKFPFANSSSTRETKLSFKLSLYQTIWKTSPVRNNPVEWYADSAWEGIFGSTGPTQHTYFHLILFNPDDVAMTTTKCTYSICQRYYGCTNTPITMGYST